MRPQLASKLNENFQMLKGALRHPKEVATIFPTSSALSQSLLRHHDFGNAKRVIELGPGTGAITRPLRERLSPRTEYLGFELDQGFAKNLKKKFAELEFINDSAQNLPAILGRKKADVIVSSIPWTMIPPETQDEMMESIVSSLRPGGTFSTYVCLNAAWYRSARHLRKLLYRNFSKVVRTPVTWANIPPAFVYFCRNGSPASE